MFEKNLVLNHLQSTRFWVMDLYVASQLPPRHQFKVSQRSKLQVALLNQQALWWSCRRRDTRYTPTRWPWARGLKVKEGAGWWFAASSTHQYDQGRWWQKRTESLFAIKKKTKTKNRWIHGRCCNDLAFGALEVFCGFEFRCVAGHMFTYRQRHKKSNDWSLKYRYDGDKVLYSYWSDPRRDR